PPAPTPFTWQVAVGALVGEAREDDETKEGKEAEKPVGAGIALALGIVPATQHPERQGRQAKNPADHHLHWAVVQLPLDWDENPRHIDKERNANEDVRLVLLVGDHGGRLARHSILDRHELDLAEEHLGSFGLEEDLAFGVAGAGAAVDDFAVEDVGD